MANLTKAEIDAALAAGQTVLLRDGDSYTIIDETSEVPADDAAINAGVAKLGVFNKRDSNSLAGYEIFGTPTNNGDGLSFNTSTGKLEWAAAPGGGGGLNDPGSNGMVARTAVNATAARTLTGTTNKIVITNGTGVSGNPTFNIGTDIVTLTDTQTLSGKTLTTPTINGGTHTGITSFGIRSSGTGAFDLNIVNTENLTAARNLTVTLNNVARTINLGGNLTLAGALTTSGANALTLTTSGATNVTLPTTGTLATLAGTETLAGKTLTTPTIGSFVNAGHDHSNAAGGGTLTPAAFGLTDPNADRLLFWDDSAGALVYLTLGTNLSITDTTLNATGGGGGTPAGTDGDYQVNLSSAFAAGVLNQGTNGRLTITPSTVASGVTKYFRIITPADTGLTADAEAVGMQFGGNTSLATVIRTLADGTTVATQRESVFVHPTYAAAGATILTDAATLAITGAPIAGTSVTITNPYALFVQGGTSRFDGAVVLNKAIISTPDVLTDAATIATDASLGNRFRVTITANRTLGNPTNAIDGQQIVWEVIQDGTGSHTLTYDTNFKFGTVVTDGTISSAANSITYVTAVYNSSTGKWNVVAVAPGY